MFNFASPVKSLFNIEPGFKAKKGKNFNHSSTICRTYWAGIHRVFRGLKFKPDAEIGQKGAFSKGLKEDPCDESIISRWSAS